MKTGGDRRWVLRMVWLLALPLFAGRALAETSVMGAITTDTVWSAENAPYVVDGNVLVQQGVTLTIEPGVEVLLAEGVAIQVDGQLIARGTAEERIRFTSKEPGTYWAYLSFEDSSVDALFDAGAYVEGSILEFTDLEYGGNSTVSNNATVRIRSARPFFKDMSVSNGRSNGFYLESGNTLTTIMENVTVRENGIFGIETYSPIQIDRSDISFNGNGFYGGPATISNTIFVGNSSGTYSFASVTVSCSSGGFVNNRVVNNKGPISVSCVSDGTGVVGNLFVNNSGSGLRLNGNVGHNVISGNLLTSNEITIINTSSNNNVLADNRRTNSGYVAYVDGGYRSSYIRNTGTSEILFNTELSESTFAYNILSDAGTGNGVSLLSGNGMSASLVDNNFISNHTDYIFSNTRTQGADAFDATNNWWDSADEADIQATIYDYFDDANRGITTYSPFRTTINTAAPISPPASLTAEVSAGSIALSWPANPESDVAGYKVYWGKEDAPFYENWVDVGNVTSHTLEGLAEGAWFVGVTAYDYDYDAAADLPETVINENMTAGHESWYTRVTANPLEASTLSHDYGELYTGFTVSETFTITNKGYTLHEIGSVYLSGDGAAHYVITEDHCAGAELPAGQGCTVTVAFAPSSSGVKAAVLSVSPTNTNHLALNITLSGQAVATGDIDVADTLSYDTVVLGGVQSLALRIDNVGTTTLSVLSHQLSGADAGEFFLQNQCTSIGSGSWCNLNIEFRPATAGAKQAVLTITSNDPDEPVMTVDLSGQADAPLSLTHLSVDKASGYAPLAVSFALTVQGGSGVYDFAWDFGQGSTSTQQNPSFTYSTAGSYTATVQVTDRNNPQNTVSGNLQINVGTTSTILPVGITALGVDVASAVVPFEASFAVTPSGGSGSYSYLWDFGDGATATVKNPTHDYTTAGDYTVVVTVSDSVNPELSSSGQLQILAIAPPTAYEPLNIGQMTASQVLGVAPMVVDFGVAGSGGSGEYGYSWDFGDGDNATGAAPSHSFTEPGSYRVSVVVRDLQNTDITTTGEMTLQVLAPAETYNAVGIEQLSASQVAGVAPMAVDFTVTGSGGSGEYSYSWNFGDGTTGTGAAPSHSYDSAGTYLVSVVVQDLNDATQSTVGQISLMTVDSPQTLSVGLTANQTSGTAPFAATFQASINGGTAPYTLTWDFGDGATETQSVDGTTSSISHTYTQAGYYQVSLVVTAADAIGTDDGTITAVMGLSVGSTTDTPTSSGDSGGGGAFDYLLLLGGLGLLLGHRRGRRD